MTTASSATRPVAVSRSGFISISARPGLAARASPTAATTSPSRAHPARVRRASRAAVARQLVGHARGLPGLSGPAGWSRPPVPRGGTAEPEQHDRPEHRVAPGADHEVHAVLHHFFDEVVVCPDLVQRRQCSAQICCCPDADAYGA